MRTLLVTYNDPDEVMTGVGAYVDDLADALTAAGHEVVYLYSGGISWRPGPRLVWTARRGRPAVRLVNSPLAPSGTQVRTAARDAADPPIEHALEQALLRVRPDVVHIHDLIGIPAAFVRIATHRGYPVVVTLHDFWPFCRRLFLLRPGLVPCPGSGAGRNCAAYCSGGSTGVRRLVQSLEVRLPSRQARRILRAGVGLYHRLRGRSSFVGVRAAVPARPSGAADPRLVQAFADREAGIRQSLLQARALLTVSESAKSAYVRHGYPVDRVRVVPIAGTASARIRWRHRTFRGYPVRFGYLGKVSSLKGAHLFVEAAAAVPPDRARFTLYGAVSDADRRFLTALSRGHPGLAFRGRYTRDQLDALLAEIDVLVFPSIAPETQGLVGREAQAAGIPIIGANCGAIPEYVHHEVNGLLFQAGSVASLQEQILRVIREPDLIGRLSRNVEPPPSMSDHVRTISEVYAEAMAPVPAVVVR